MPQRPDLRIVAVNERPRRARDEQWAWFELQGETAKARGRLRCKVVAEIEALIASGSTKTRAIETIARRHGVSRSTINSWFRAIRGVGRGDRLPYLTPGFVAGGRAVPPIDATAWHILKRFYLHPNGYSWAHSVERTAIEYCKPRGIVLPSSRTLMRRLRGEIGERAIRVFRSKTLSRRHGVLPENYRPGIAPDGRPVRQRKPRRTTRRTWGRDRDAD